MLEVETVASEIDMNTRVSRIENTLYRLAIDIESVAKHQEILTNNLSKITDILIKQAEYEQMATKNTKDISVLFKTIRDIDEKGTQACAVHKMADCGLETKVIELKEMISNRDKLLIKTVSTLFITGIIAFVSLVFKINNLLH